MALKLYTVSYGIINHTTDTYFLLLPVSSQKNHLRRFVQLIKSR
jgi:hypothetical protein